MLVKLCSPDEAALRRNPGYSFCLNLMAVTLERGNQKTKEPLPDVTICFDAILH